MRGNLVVILGDQLSRHISAMDGFEPDRDTVLMAEVMDEATYVPHHKKKLAYVLAAMRHFADALRSEGITVDYCKLDDRDGPPSLLEAIKSTADRMKPERIIITHPGEWRLLDDFRKLQERHAIPVDIREDTRFFCPIDAFADWASGRKTLVMEQFYRRMRKQTGYLMDSDQPLGGRWNFDSENRKPANRDLEFTGPARFAPDDITAEVIEMVERRFSGHFGRLDDFWFAVTRTDARKALDHFIERALPSFGDFQDAMLTGEPHLYHAVLSLYINAGLLGPREVCEAVLTAYENRDLPLNAVEGFIRQIVGWREFIRGVYWLNMPDYRGENYFQAHRDLPRFYWTGQTNMACLAAAIGQTRDEAYAHHIQRLMVTGNFALLIGAEPLQVHEWYLAVYADAYEWVELPNTLGMSQYADGGLLATKPYASAGNYINKMSDYCSNCAYDVKEKTGDRACPFNYLYWDFLARNKDKLGGNQRLAMPYHTWSKMDRQRKKAIRQSARKFLESL